MKCNYCGNNSGIKDDLGGCVSCGGFSVPDWQVPKYLDTSTHTVGPVPSIDKIQRMNFAIKANRVLQVPIDVLLDSLGVDWKRATN